MAITPDHIVITNPDGSTTTVDVTWAPPPVVTPPPTVSFPDGANTVTIGTFSYPLAAIDPPTTDPTMPGGRGPNQLIIITKSSTPARNKWGWEVPVKSGLTGTGGVQVDLALSGEDYILSGNGNAADFLRGSSPNLPVKVEFKFSTPVPPVVTPPAALAPVMGVYLMDGVGHVSQLPSKCNRALIAFYQGTDLVEWGGDAPAKTASDLKAWRSGGGREIVISLGGQGGNVVLDKVDEGIAAINSRFPVDGIDWDAEAFSYSAADAVSVSRACAAAIGRSPANFVVQFVPPGGNPVAPALIAAKACQDAGFRVTFGQQLYETSITDDDVISATKRAVDILGPKSVLVGIMIGDSHNSWTTANAVSRMKAVKAKWNDIGGAYLWESARAGTDAVVQGVGTVLGL
jgi:hypothetical protein